METRTRKPMVQALASPRTMTSLPSPAVARNLERIAWLMDRAIKIPGTNITLGLDALLGLLPLGGDILTGFIQTGLVLVALKHYHVPGRWRHGCSATYCSTSPSARSRCSATYLTWCLKPTRRT